MPTDPGSRPVPAGRPPRRARRPGPARPSAARERRRRRARRRAVLLVFAVAVGAVGWAATRSVIDTVRGEVCTITAAGTSETFDPEQTGNAALIAALSIKRRMPPRAATIALTTAFQESKIRNLRFGDRDSLGLFQQRPSQGWGTEAQVLDPVHATNAFYDALVKFRGYETADITQIAQRVQRSAYPDAYRDHEGQGRVLASTLTGNSPAGVTCGLRAATSHAAPATVRAALAEQMGITAATLGPGTLTVTAADTRLAWAVGHWAVAQAGSTGATQVRVGDRSWSRDRGADGWSPGRASPTVTITLR
ncbi:MAG TPA: hypothetical protein VFJ94_08900 [Intrasporangium sp.]|uniref:hypothetical protein n=1 Tax=Intrasporangium sp. TaxID=1925024 RepID=UPI002D777D30|nr:hypothetical protein [Intrasporangium sp.]HET7398627.1 hypothetical protein [Intrasporangium sp.]